MFEICFTTACSLFNNPTDGFVFIGNQMYKGSESAPIMLSGTFISSYAYAYVSTAEFFQSPDQDIVAANIPEPSAALPMSVAGLFLAAVMRRWRPRALLC